VLSYNIFDNLSFPKVVGVESSVIGARSPLTFVFPSSSLLVGFSLLMISWCLKGQIFHQRENIRLIRFFSWTIPRLDTELRVPSGRIDYYYYLPGAF
jgi:hypothetical protein